jgi:site-specific recombinase XerD
VSAKTSQRNSAVASASANPLRDFPERFEEDMKRLHYSVDSIQQYRKYLTELGDQMKARRVRMKDLDVDVAAKLLAKPGQPARQDKYQRAIVKKFLAFLCAVGEIGPVPEKPVEVGLALLQRSYEEYLRRQRGLSECTIFHNWRVASRFLTYRFRENEVDLPAIGACDIAAFLQMMSARRPVKRDKTLCSHLRNFFRFLFQAGRIQANLALGIPNVAQRYKTRLPRHLSAEQVNALVEAVRRQSPNSRRNYAMVLLIARLGLRAPEVIAMQIDDIDWRSGEIMVRGKGQRHDRVPLPHEVGEALADYIRLDRVTATRDLFVTERAPHGPFKGSTILNEILLSAFRRSGLEPPAPYVGSHVLRHSLATSLLQRGASLDEIADTLRHRSRATTMMYARLDIDGLRSVAPQWPVAGGER